MQAPRVCLCTRTCREPSTNKLPTCCSMQARRPSDDAQFGYYQSWHGAAPSPALPGELWRNSATAASTRPTRADLIPDASSENFRTKHLSTSSGSLSSIQRASQSLTTTRPIASRAFRNAIPVLLFHSRPRTLLTTTDASCLHQRRNHGYHPPRNDMLPRPPPHRNRAACSARA